MLYCSRGARNLDPRGVARALGGDAHGNRVYAPGPGHSALDRSMSVLIEPTHPDGFLVYSFSGDPWPDCRAYVRERLRLPEPDGMARPRRIRSQNYANSDCDNVSLAQYLWRMRRPIEGTLGEIYLRQARAYAGKLIPATLAFLPPRGIYGPAMIAAHGMANETEPGTIAICDSKVRGVRITQLAVDGMARIGKKMLGRGADGFPIVVAPPNDLLAIAVCEGVEDALSVHDALGIGAWAAGDAGRMPALANTIPAWIESVLVITDDNSAGRFGSAGLIAGLQARGIHAVAKVLRSEPSQ